MAVTVTTRPAAWNAGKNPVVYKFATTGGPFVNYRIEVEVFKASDDSSLTGGVKFSFSPNAAGITYADISTIVKAFLKAEWIEPSALNEVEVDTGLEVYIKYQELYDGSAVGVVDDVANPKQIVFAALQIPSASGGDMDAYVPEDNTKKFLTVFDQPFIWRGYPATLSFIYPDAIVVALYLYRSQYDEAGTIIGSEDGDALNNSEKAAVNRLDLFSGFALNALAQAVKLKLALLTAGTEKIPNPGFDVSLFTWSSETDANPAWAWNAGTYAEVTLTPGQQSEYLWTSLISNPLAAGLYYLDYDADPRSGGVTIIISVFDASNVLVQELVNEVLINALTTYTLVANITAAFERVKIKVSSVGSAAPRMHRFSFKPLTPADHTEELTYRVKDACANPVLLVWKNSIGGDAWWLFEHEQELEYKISGSKKAKRMTLFADNLSVDEWEGLNELNSIGETYKQNNIEFTSSVNKSHIQEGTQVYVVDTSGNKIGVIVIPTINVMYNRQVKHRFKIEIELPDRYE